MGQGVQDSFGAALGPELALPLGASESDHGTPRPTSGHCWPWMQVSPWVWSLFLYGLPFLGLPGWAVEE